MNFDFDSTANSPESQEGITRNGAMKFFYANEPEKQFRFVKTPKSLFEDDEYADMSICAKVLYSFMLDRVSLSKKSGNWTDPNGRIFIYFPIQEVMTLFHIANEKATKLYKELENAGLIQREKNGYGKPTRIYVCDALEDIHDFRESIVTDSVNHCHENRESIVTKNRSHIHGNRDTSLYETEFNETDNIETDFSDTIIPPNPPKGGTGENFPVSPESVNSAGTGKGRRQRREQSAALKSELSPEEEEELSAMSPRLRDAVRDWMADKAQRRNPYTPTSKRALIGMVQRNVGQYGADIVAQTIEESTANGYAGIAWSRAAQMKKAKEDEARAQEERKKELPSYGFKIIGDDDGKRTAPEKRWPDFSNW